VIYFNNNYLSISLSHNQHKGTLCGNFSKISRQVASGVGSFSWSRIGLMSVCCSKIEGVSKVSIESLVTEVKPSCLS